MTPQEGCVHYSFKTTSPVGPVFIAHHNRKVSGLLLIEYQGKVNSHQDFASYMKNNVGAEVVNDQNRDPAWQAYINEAVVGGRADVPVSLTSRSLFQQSVLRAATKIPLGETRTYKELATAIGRPKAVRAVGSALAKNPIPLLIPCHRVVPGNGGVGGYAYGSELKRILLEHEGATT